MTGNGSLWSAVKTASELAGYTGGRRPLIPALSPGYRGEGGKMGAVR